MLGESRWRRKRKSRPQRGVLTPCPVLFALATPSLLGNHGAGPRVLERIILQKGGALHTTVIDNSKFKRLHNQGHRNQSAKSICVFPKES